MFVLQLAIASLLAAGLGAREAFRYRLLVSKAAIPTTLLAVVALLVWLTLLVWSAITIGVLKAAGVFAIPFVIGNLVRVTLATISGGNDLLSPESSAKGDYEHVLASRLAADCVNRPQIRDLIQRFHLAPDDFKMLYDAARRQGLGHDVALRAMTHRKLIAWYFENIGKDGKFSLDTSFQFIHIARGDDTE